MNYYEELGIPTGAPVEEVRRAYRTLARLVHPDQQPQEARPFAEIQMARLNQIRETLTDPQRRARYHASLGLPPDHIEDGRDVFRSRRPAARSRRRRRSRRFVWPAAAILGMGLILLFVGQDSAVQRSPGGDLTSSRMSLARPVRAGRYDVPGLTAGALENPFSSLDRRADAGAGGRFDGDWFYARPAKLADPDDLHPPVYIDLHLSEFMGTVAGRYSAGYKVEAPISPLMTFEFDGAATEPAAELTWRTTGLAGHIRLSLLTAETMRVEWTADKPGANSLTSGTATLARRAAP